MNDTAKRVGCLFFVPMAAAVAAVTQVPAGANLQQYINAAHPGDTLVLQANATYAGNFTLPNLTSRSQQPATGHPQDPRAGYVTITTSDMASLPPAGIRVSSSYAPHMPKLVAPPGNLYAPVVRTLPGAHHFAFVGVEFAPSPGQQIWHEILLGEKETSTAELPHDFIFDRCYIHGDPNRDAKTGLVFNGINMTVENSYISGFKSTSWDTAAVGGWNGPGPFTIVNNYLEASGENVFWGGATPSLRGVVPSDIEIRGNYVTKPLSWRQGDPSYAGTLWVVKNLLELKSGRRVTIEGNIFENCWYQAQAGYAILFTVRTEGGSAPWLAIENVTFRNNIVRHAAGVFSIAGKDSLSNFGGRGDSLTIDNNLFYDINHQKWGGPYSPVALILDGFTNISITHNTCLDMNVIAYFGGPPSKGFVMENNIFPGSNLGIIADGMNQAETVFNAYAPGAIFTNNAVIGGNPKYYTEGNLFPPDLKSIGFINPSEQNYALASNSRYAKAGADKTGIGANMAALNAATFKALTGGASGATVSGPASNGGKHDY
jgi:hypothetical protein